MTVNGTSTGVPPLGPGAPGQGERNGRHPRAGCPVCVDCSYAGESGEGSRGERDGTQRSGAPHDRADRNHRGAGAGRVGLRVPRRERRPPGKPGDPLIITIPAHGTQLTSVTSVPIVVDLPRVQPGSLQMQLTTGGSFGAPVDVTSRFTVANRTATATLGASDFAPGLTRLVVSGVPDGGGARIHRDSVWSWEPAIDVSRAGQCEFLGQTRCQMPFPSNWFTEADASSHTGRRVHFGAQTWTPTAGSAPAIDPTEWNRNDGFSPGSTIIVSVPGVDLARTGAAPITDIAESLQADQPIVVLDATTGERWPFFAELDANATSDATRSLIIRPAKNFPSGHHIVVGLASMKRADGSVIPTGRAFQVYRDLVPTFIPQVEQRRATMNDSIRALEGVGMTRSSLYLAWDFTVASDQNLTGRSLHIRDDAFASIGSGAPAFTVATVQDDVSSTIWRRVTGTVDVPLYLTGTGAPGSEFSYAAGAGKDALPVRNGTFKAQFICNIPRSTTAAGADPVDARQGARVRARLARQPDGGELVRPAGEHVQLGDVRDAVDRDVERGRAERRQHPPGPQRLPDPRRPPAAELPQHAVPGPGDEEPERVRDQRRVPCRLAVEAGDRDGGGLLQRQQPGRHPRWGGDRAVEGVDARGAGRPPMNYSTLLTRSIDYDQFGAINAQAYPDEVDRLLGLSLIQMLWDRGENNAYAYRMTTNPLPGSPAHTILLIEAFGDHQVTNVATETMARTVPGMHVWQPTLAPGRSTDVTPMWGIPAIPSTPYSGSALVQWDYGTPAPPITNTPNRAGTPARRGSANPGCSRRPTSSCARSGPSSTCATAAPANSCPRGRFRYESRAVATRTSRTILPPGTVPERTSRLTRRRRAARSAPRAAWWSTT